MKKILGNVEYKILETIADGGMGTVYKALMKGVNGFEKVVAIKTLLNCYSKDKRFISRFIDEAKLVANLVHENIVQIYQLDKYMNEYYFVLEHVDGINLYDFMEFHLKTNTRLPAKLAVFIASNVARALAYAHSRYSYDGKPLNIIHCDVCSHNILINTEGVVKLADFGVARAVTVKERTSVSGKLPFMSPEQVNKEPLDFHTDIYSLGVVLFYMLSGGKTCRHLDVNPHEIISQAQKNYIDWGLLPDNLNKDLLVILHRMLSSDPEKRYRSASKVAKKLEQYISRNGYGPNNVSMAKYMRREMPALFANKIGSLEAYELNEKNISKTIKLSVDNSGLESKSETSRLTKTHPMSKEELTKSAVFKSKYI
jgi:eukaryotic-like serine/threonine-protein kinase